MKMEELMDNENLWHIQEHIFGYLNHKTVEICRKVCKTWKESLKHIALVILLQEFGDRDIEFGEGKVSTYIPGWKKAVQKYGARASIEDLQEVKDSLGELLECANEEGKCCSDPVHEAAKNGAAKLMDIIFITSYDLNARLDGNTVLHLACIYGRTETVELLIKSSKDLSIDLNYNGYNGSTRTGFYLACFNGNTETVELMIKLSKDFSIDLNARDDIGGTALHSACQWNTDLETIKLMLKNWKEYSIDIKARDNYGQTPLDCVKSMLECYKFDENLKQKKELLENEYSKMDDAP